MKSAGPHLVDASTRGSGRGSRHTWSVCIGRLGVLCAVWTRGHRFSTVQLCAVVFTELVSVSAGSSPVLSRVRVFFTSITPIEVPFTFRREALEEAPSVRSLRCTSQLEDGGERNYHAHGNHYRQEKFGDLISSCRYRFLGFEN